MKTQDILPYLRCADQAADTCKTPKGKQAFVSAKDFQLLNKIQ